MKTIVKTTGAFMLSDRYTGDQVNPFRPSVVSNSPFIEQRIAAGQLKVLEGNLPLTATDADFAEFWKENKESAVDAFLSTLSEPEPKPKPAPASKPEPAPAPASTPKKTKGQSKN